VQQKERRSPSCLDGWKLKNRCGRHQERLDRRSFGDAHVGGCRSKDRHRRRRRGNRLARGFVDGVVCVIVVVVVGVSCR